jgi:hypothetical protein
MGRDYPAHFILRLKHLIMQLQKAERKQAKIKLAIQGCSGGGKTYSALLLAYGLCSNWSKVAIIDTENYSASLYAHLGGFSVLNIAAPFSPEKYNEAIKLCEQSGIEVIIIDSISHEWEGSGGIIDTHSSMSGNSFTNWGKLTPRHNAFVQAILQSSSHIIGTIRSKQEYVLNEKNGKQVPEKVGLKGVTREGMDYEMTIVFDLDIKHHAVASKDRTGIFMDKPEFRITTATGREILKWCNEGKELVPEDLQKRINDCKSVNELLKLFEKQEALDNDIISAFTKKRSEIELSNKTNQNQKENGKLASTTDK